MFIVKHPLSISGEVATQAASFELLWELSEIGIGDLLESPSIHGAPSSEILARFSSCTVDEQRQPRPCGAYRLDMIELRKRFLFTVVGRSGRG